MNSAQRTDRDTVLYFTALLSHRALRGRVDQLNLPLKPDEERRLAELERVFGAGGSLAPRAGETTTEGGEGDEAARPAFLLRLEGRSPVRIPVEFQTGTGEWIGAALSDLSSSGFFVKSEAPVPVGERLLFRFFDLGAGRVWQFAGQVERIAGGVDGGMGLRFHGLPLELRLGDRGPRSRRVRIAA